MKPVLIYDGRCSFCRIWIDYWRRLTGDRVEYAASEDVRGGYPQISEKEFSESVQLVRPDGTFSSGAHAVFETLRMERTYESSRVFAWLSEAAYRFIARRRDLFYHLTRFTFGRRIEPARFELTQWIFLRALALIYAAAFLSLGLQVAGLIGSAGILPLERYLDAATRVFGAARFTALPTIFWANGSDDMLRGACAAGVVFAVLLLFGRLQRLMLALLFVLYLSLSSAGQDFLTFQWDALLIESGFLAIFLGRSPAAAWLFRCLAFRLMFLSGAVKLLSHDPSWRNLTALEYHFHTQPLPTFLAWYADKLPASLERASTVVLFAIEIGAPFLIFAPRKLRMFAAGCLIGLQVLILLTGNYAFFNLLTIALCLFLFDDQALRSLVPRRLRERFHLGEETLAPRGRPARLNRAMAGALVVVMLTLGLLRIVETFGDVVPEPLRFLARAAGPFQIVNSYGLFAVMTTTRPEIIVEGSRDGQIWQAYEFRYKPGDLNRRPRWAAPHQPRLDWQMWFAALGTYRTNLWFVAFAEKLLEGSPAVLALLEKNPFPDRPPRFVRALVYEYSFSDRATRRRTGAWWTRRPLGVYLPEVGFKSSAEPVTSGR